MSKIAYKGFDVNKNNQLYCRNMIYELDKEYVIDDNLKLCENGIHFCWELRDVNRYYNFHNSTICEVEILGDVVEGEYKACTNKLKILRIIDKEELMELTNEGIDNDGYFNKGNHNIGDWNIGNDNKGSHNEGNDNEDHFNKGNGNRGSRNTGNNNIGSWNTGDSNTGYSNTGNKNTGDWNTGNDNKGDHNDGNDNKGIGNVGDGNKGNSNNGSYNKGNNIIGFFNTINNIGSLGNIALFNKLSNISMEEFKQMKVYKLMDISIHSYSWESLSNDDKELISQLPNFDKNIFE